MSYLATDLEQARRDCHDLAQRCQEVHLAVEREVGELHLGSSPCVQLDDDYHVYINQNPALMDCLLGNGQVELVFIEHWPGVQISGKPRRLTISGQAENVPRGYRFTRAMVAFQDRLGSFMDIVRGRPDGRLVRVKPVAGRYVDDSSRAYTFTGNRLETLRPEQDQSQVISEFTEARSAGVD